MTDWTTLTYAVVDVEGNGQQPPDLVELAVVPIVGGIIQQPATWLVKPDQPITPFARKIHGITNEQVAHSPAFDRCAAAIQHALDADALVAHAAHVDVGVLQRKLGDWQCSEVFDTLTLSRRLLPDQDSYRLGALADSLSLASDLPSRLQPHRAEYDALVCARLFVYLAGRHSLDALRNPPPEGSGDEAQALF
jgi:DNA polymerase III epsilon subunit-like protein